MVVAGLGVAIFAVMVWYKAIYLDEQRTFWGGIDNALSVGTVTKSGSTNNANQNISQAQTLSFRGDVGVQNLITVASPDETEKIRVETQGYADADYFRYLELKLADQAQSDKAVDALNVWGVSDSAAGSNPQLLVESLVSSYVIYGNFGGQTKDNLKQILRDGVYNVDFATAIRTKSESGRPVYVYRVSVDMQKFSKLFAEYMRSLGNATLAGVVEAQSDSLSGVTKNVDLSIDARSRNIISIVDLQSGNNGDIYTAQGAFSNFSRPTDAIDFSELRARLDN